LGYTSSFRKASTICAETGFTSNPVDAAIVNSKNLNVDVYVWDSIILINPTGFPFGVKTANISPRLMPPNSPTLI
jgi:hypothetical protein